MQRRSRLRTHAYLPYSTASPKSCVAIHSTTSAWQHRLQEEDRYSAQAAELDVE